MKAFPSIKLTHATPDLDAGSDAPGFVGRYHQRQTRAMPKKSRIRQIRGSYEEGVVRGVVQGAVGDLDWGGYSVFARNPSSVLSGCVS